MKFATMFVKPKRKRRRTYKIYISMISWVDLAIYACLSVRFLRFQSEILHTSFFPQEAVFVRIAAIGPLYHMAAIQTEQSESNAYIENFFIWQDIFTKFGMEYYPRQSNTITEQIVQIES